MQHVLWLEQQRLQGEPDGEAEQRRHEAEQEVDRRGADEVELGRPDRLVPYLHEEREGRCGEQRLYDVERTAHQAAGVSGERGERGRIGGGDLRGGEDTGFDVHGGLLCLRLSGGGA